MKKFLDGAILVLIILVSAAGFWKLFEIGIFVVQHVQIGWMP